MNYILDRINKYRKRLQFAKYCFSSGDDDRFVRTVKSIGKENNLVNLEGYGSEPSNDVLSISKLNIPVPASLQITTGC